MASSCSISLLAPSFPIKIVPYDPLAPKPNPKSKSKAKAKIKTAEHNHSETVSFKDRGEWFDIDDFPMPDSNASLSLNPGVHPRFEVAVPSGSPHQDVVGGVGAAFLPDEPEHCQSGQESLDDGGTGNATDVTKTNSATNELLGRSPEFPLNLEGDVAEDHSIMHVEPSDRASDYQANGYNEAAGTEGYHAIQYSDPDTVGMRALSVEDMEVVRHKRPPAEDEPLFSDIGVTSGPPIIRKRTHSLSTDTIISPAEVVDLTSKPELEERRLAKRRRLAKQRVENLILDPVSMPKSTPLPSPSSQVPSPRASNGPRPDFPECNDKGDGAESPGLYSSRQSISPFEGTVSEQDINPDSDRREKSRKGRRSEVGESHRDELNQVDVSYGASATPPQRHNPSNRSVQERPRGRPQTHLKPQNGSTVFRKTSRQLTSPPSQQLSGPRADSTARISRIGPPRTFSTGAKAAYDSSIYRGTSDYELMDIAHYYCDVPNDSPIITATVYCADVMSALYAKSSALRWNLLGNKGEVIRTIKLSSDSWLVIGYRHDDCGAPKLCSGRGSMQRSTDRETGRHSNAINYDAVHPETYGNEKYEDEDEDVSDNGYMLSGKRTHVPWKESDGQRLLSYKDKMGLDWDDIVFRFPGRSVGAVKLRYYTLHKKDS